MATKHLKKVNVGEDPKPAYRVFISSSFEDMKEFRVAAQQAISNVEAVPKGMERFTASIEPVIERCYEEIRDSQIFVAILGSRYGSLYPGCELSYSEMEYNEAERLEMPILVFVQEGDLYKNAISDDDFSRLLAYKKRLISGGKRMAATFKSEDDLRSKLADALRTEFERMAQQAVDNKNDEDAYMKGAAEFKKFLILPGKYCDQKVRLRVRFEGHFGSWRLKEELYEAFDMPMGQAIFFNDLFVMGADYSDLGDEAKHIDCFAVGDAAEWILENHVTKGSVFEGNFTMEYKYVKNVAGKSRIQVGASDAYIAKLILRDADDLELIEQSSNSSNAKRGDGGYSQDSVLDLLRQLV